MIPSEIKTKRVFQLNVYDIFTWAGSMRKVVRIEGGFIYHKRYGQDDPGSEINALGWHSQELVEYHFNNKKK